MDREPLRYKDAGVDIDAQEEGLRSVKRLAQTTFTRGVLSEIGLFGGLFALDPEDPRGTVLVASADGVGTKLQVAEKAGRYDTVGEDLVNHCVNDILVQGAMPLFFLDYFAAGRLDPQRLVEVVSGLARGCRQNGCALLGGETAEMPGLYQGEDFDLAGFIVGRAARDRLLPRQVAPGQVLLGLPSSGLHTNGYSLARKLFFEIKGFTTETRLDDLGAPLGEVLLAVHRSYLKPLQPLLHPASGLRGLAHITGGGIPDNLPRILPEGVRAAVRPKGWIEPPIFGYIRKEGKVSEAEMRRTFNLGVGMVLVADAQRVGEMVEALRRSGETPFVVGELKEGDRGVEYED